ncbi:hypothetical protein [Photorhabdus bodei]|nr:hypothetical protein [Photorhabdus bodei]
MTGVSECSQQRGNLKDNGYSGGNVNSDYNTFIETKFILISHKS